MIDETNKTPFAEETQTPEAPKVAAEPAPAEEAKKTPEVKPKKTKKSGKESTFEKISDIVTSAVRGRGGKTKKNADETPKPPAAPRMLVAIIERGKSVRFREILQKNGIFLSEVCMGNGTASSDILDILGLESTEKDVIISITDAEAASSMMSKLSDQLAGSFGSKGIAFSLRLSAAPNILIKALELKSGKTPQEARKKMTDAYTLIVITVNQGYADEVVATAKKGGARGGTLIRARQASNENTDSLFSASFTSERDVVAILAPKDKRADIMEALNAEHGVRSEANAVVIALPVESVAKLS